MSPEFGGVYVPEVMVYRYSDGREIKPFRTAMVYAAPSALAAPAMSEEQLQQYLDCMKEEIRNVLRMCSFKGHDEIVLGAWGCDGASPCAEAIAERFASLGIEGHGIVMNVASAESIDAGIAEVIKEHGAIGI